MDVPPFDPLSLEFTRDPHPVLAALRERDPVHFHRPFGAWVVTRYDDLRTLYHDERVARNLKQATATAGGAGAVAPNRAEMFANMGAKTERQHVRERKLVSMAFTRQAVARMDSQIATVVEEHLATLPRLGRVVDLAPACCAIPNAVISRILGVPPQGDDEERFVALATQAIRIANPFLRGEALALADKSLGELRDYVRELIAERRAHPQDDLLSGFAQASEGGERLEDRDLLGWVVGLLMAGSETTAHALLLSVRTLLAYPAQANELRRDLTLVPNAVLECLRFDMFAKFLPRVAQRDFELRGRAIREGQLCFLLPTAAHRDPRAFREPERFDVRRDTSAHVLFGRGPHNCVGAHLARTELACGIAGVLKRFSDGSRVLEEGVGWDPTSLNVRLMTSLPVERPAVRG
ncbi:MAG: cytochrome P450 [Proteobacteria bacterium]|nr:cytochrome P450 [Pseudomonadota bacterium]